VKDGFVPIIEGGEKRQSTAALQNASAKASYFTLSGVFGASKFTQQIQK
jgi:hypothetical protein